MTITKRRSFVWDINIDSKGEGESDLKFPHSEDICCGSSFHLNKLNLLSLFNHFTFIFVYLYLLAH